ncbi:hypothetical protein MPTK1_1g23250 [Marchantia polymorpha subsp. ruderalis]|uniref:Uncharacterized protein n=2 Tax=Marchantia polymorpha TaxID=3197 RepID=A0AAF6ATE3_MARPO|nr:hypothetical protein MARPO_0065s0053 [Marchantia polymorpha]BBM99713.1 hypothetical protein Mp_1g23250 [Marchantia polymorpha subsp. ruderalis]|eukprot:PTQ36243.1 hypothetical protein MARPO_0065s0053 [Marchantia polymorpha]
MRRDGVRAYLAPSAPSLPPSLPPEGGTERSMVAVLVQRQRQRVLVWEKSLVPPALPLPLPARRTQICRFADLQICLRRRHAWKHSQDAGTCTTVYSSAASERARAVIHNGRPLLLQRCTGI